jgi:AcrR family transcriptional regulator
MYDERVPKLWTDTVEEHRRAVRDATIDATARLVAQQGLASVTMSKIAAETGIGRATLYKYFPDMEAILLAWHERQVAHHLEELTAIREQAGDPAQRLQAVLQAYAARAHGQPHSAELSALLHRGKHVDQAHRHLTTLVEEMVRATAQVGQIRDDVPAAELARYCLSALSAAGDASSEDEIDRLVLLVLTGLRSQNS